jgi:hypothetical protein
MKDLDVGGVGVFGSESTPGSHIGDFAKHLNRLRFPLLLDRVGILDFKSRNDSAMRQRNAISLFRGVLQGKIRPLGARAKQHKFIRTSNLETPAFMRGEEKIGCPAGQSPGETPFLGETAKTLA